MQKFKKLICAALAGCLLVPLASCGTEKADVSDIFDSNEKISYCTTYSELSETKTNREPAGTIFFTLSTKHRLSVCSGMAKKESTASPSPFARISSSNPSHTVVCVWGDSWQA